MLATNLPVDWATGDADPADAVNETNTRVNAVATGVNALYDAIPAITGTDLNDYPAGAALCFDGSDAAHNPGIGSGLVETWVTADASTKYQRMTSFDQLKTAHRYKSGAWSTWAVITSA